MLAIARATTPSALWLSRTNSSGLGNGLWVTAAARSVSSCSRRMYEYYKTEEEFLFALADALSEEYRAVVTAGFILQIDDPGLPDWRDMLKPEPTVEAGTKPETQRRHGLLLTLRRSNRDSNPRSPLPSRKEVGLSLGIGVA